MVLFVQFVVDMLLLCSNNVVLYLLLLFSLSDVAEELRLPAASRRPYVGPAAGESHAVRRGRHAALLRHSCDGNTGRDDHRVSCFELSADISPDVQMNV